MPRIHADHVLRGYEAVATRLLHDAVGSGPARGDPPGAREPAGPRRRGPARDDARPGSPLPRRAVSAPHGGDRRAAAPDSLVPHRGGGPGRRALRDHRAADRGARRAAGLPGRGRAAARRLRRDPGLPLAGRDVRLPSRLARDPPALRGPRPGAPRSHAQPRHDLPGPGPRARPRRLAGRGPGHLPGRGGDPAALRRGRLPPLRGQLHPHGGRRHGRPAAGRHGRRRNRPDRGHERLRPRPGQPGHRAAVRVGGRARELRRGPGDAAGQPRLPPPPGVARQPPGSDARLLRLEQGVGLPRGGVDALPGPVAPGRGGAPQRHRADPLPRPRRRHRPRRRPDEPGHPGPGPALDRRPLQDDRAGRDGRGQLLQRRHRRAPPRAGCERGGRRVHSRARRLRGRGGRPRQGG